MYGLFSPKKEKTVAREETEQARPSFTGTLMDEDIRKYASQKLLISDNYDPDRVDQACYELRASDIYYYPIESNAKKEVTKEEGAILLRPNQVVVIITVEALNIPNDILGRVLTKGSLFSLGITAVNTYVDPGFSGRMGIVFQNLSTKYLKIPVGEPIAKIEFSKLHAPVKTPYHGQHGYATKIWPIRREFFVDETELKNRFRISDPDSGKELGLRYGEAIQRMYESTMALKNRLLLTIIILTIFTLFVTGIAFHVQDTGKHPLELFINVMAGIISSLIATILLEFRKKK